MKAAATASEKRNFNEDQDPDDDDFAIIAAKPKKHRFRTYSFAKPQDKFPKAEAFTQPRVKASKRESSIYLVPSLLNVTGSLEQTMLVTQGGEEAAIETEAQSETPSD